jgi:hypothetical protein
LLEDVVTAEALLETQLRTYGVAPQIIGEVLEERNKLLSSLAQDHPYSHNGIAQALIDASNDEHDLELALVVAARTLGFVAKHISGAGEPDGLARHVAYPGKVTLLTLEAKASADVPSLSAIDFAGLHEHRKDKKADGVLLVAPSYPGGKREEDAAAAKRSIELQISCWTVEQLARVVRAAEARHFNAETVINIVLKAFSPLQVATAINDLFKAPIWDQQSLASAIIDALEKIAEILQDMDRTVEAIAPAIASNEKFRGITKEDIVKASSDLSAGSQGALAFDGSVYTVLTSFDELRRRATAVAGEDVRPLRPGTFRLFPNAEQ